MNNYETPSALDWHPTLSVLALHQFGEISGRCLRFLGAALRSNDDATVPVCAHRCNNYKSFIANHESARRGRSERSMALLDL